eukprot:CAMPEP_0176433334 /NCGR_PEP_ID=MMETSP0127-20121128/15954_1 /TAXON_ID=938130 /ORGANISM="Platyophrya macrostoma, Strain WH" /LENGTH=173 /DNA_ID=CAMNT_0017815729 /DNA_START=51 /DNA_END=572 /DNA_ORIENTATION=-
MASFPATFAAGCFWGTERYFKKQFGEALLSYKVGYMGGTTTSPSYQDVCTGTTGHAEVLHLECDASKVTYDDLVQFFFRMHNPTTKNQQGNDRGTQYRSAIFYHSEAQRTAAESYIRQLQENEKLAATLSRTFGTSKISTTVEPASVFYEAEAYHQRYLEANPRGYCNHRVYW